MRLPCLRGSAGLRVVRNQYMGGATMMLIRTRVGPSSIHGMGLFAVNGVKRGAPIWRFQPGFDHAFDRNAYMALPPLAREHVRWFCFVSRETGLVILSGDHACFINHAADPSTGSPPDRPWDGTTVALRDLQPGDEITCDYFAYDADVAWKLRLSGHQDSARDDDFPAAGLQA